MQEAECCGLVVLKAFGVELWLRGFRAKGLGFWFQWLLVQGLRVQGLVTS